jgi:Tfp pilus assembly protein PilX
MTKESKSTRKERGSALISALAIVAIMSFLMSGVCLLSTSYADRQRREADYALAMQLAEAGANYEINYYSVNNTVHLSNAPCSGSVPGLYCPF